MEGDDQVPSWVVDDDRPPDEPENPSGAATVQPTGRRVPARPAERTEKALGLEVARLFGVSPRLLTGAAPPAGRDSDGEDRALNKPAAEQDQTSPSDPNPQASNR